MPYQQQQQQPIPITHRHTNPPGSAPASAADRHQQLLSSHLVNQSVAGAGAGKNFLLSLQNHPTLTPFLRPDFDAAAFSAQVVVADGVSAGTSRSRAEVMVAQLTEQLGQVEHAIEKHISQHQRQLMQNMGDLGELRENCDVLTVRSKELRRSVDKLTNELLDPYQSTELRTQQLRRIHEANDLLKKVARFSSTLARLKKTHEEAAGGGIASGGGGEGEDKGNKKELDDKTASAHTDGDPTTAIKKLELRELAKAAHHLHEIEILFQDPKLGGISLLVADRPYVTLLGRSLRQTAKERLKVALQNMNQADLGAALQVFYNLENLAPVVLESVGAIVAEAAEATRRALDAATLERVANAASAAAAAAAGASSSSGGKAGGEGSSSSSSSASPTGSSASGRGGLAEMEAIALRQRRARFRDHCDKWATALCHCALKVWHLQRVLQKKVDATTYECFLDVVLRSEDFQKAWEHAWATCPPSPQLQASSSLSSSRGGAAGPGRLKRGHISCSSTISTNTNPLSGSSIPPVGALYWIFWMEFTAAIRKVAETASKRASSNPFQAAVVKSYPYFVLALAEVLNRLLDNTSKHKAAGGLLPAAAGTGVAAQGNPAALQALMETLGVNDSSSSSSSSSSSAAEMGLIGNEERGAGGAAAAGTSSSSLSCLAEVAGGSVEERTVMVESLGSLRDLYLGASLQRLCRPIEQMFPSVEGYKAAVPSKHDLQAFFKVLQMELLGGLTEGGPLLLPDLVRGVVKAVHLFYAKVEAMTNTSENARKLYALRGWILGPEKEHNLQLLQLVAFLHQALLRLPKDLAAASLEFMGGTVGAGALGDRELGDACAALEALAVTGFVQPYMLDIANELGGILAEMHLENYAPKGSTTQQQGQQQQQSLSLSSSAGADGGNSRFINAFQAAVTALRKHHLSRFPIQADFVTRAFKWLAGRLLRTYVSHAALLRPLNEAGKTKLTNDMAMMETALSSIHPKVSELGAPYLELKAFRELCFYGDEQNPLTVNGLAKERFTVHLRPSTLLDALFARAPLELSSPHVLQRCSERTLVEELLALYYEDKKLSGQAAVDAQEDGGAAMDPRVVAETAHWQVVQVCLDAYAQRMSASQIELAYIYDVMLNLGGYLLKAFGERLVKEREKQGRERGPSGGGLRPETTAARALPLNW